MKYQIIVEFPSKEIADEFCGQMSDGFGENYCDFSFHKQREGTDGTKREHFEVVHDREGRRVYFVNKLFGGEYK